MKKFWKKIKWIFLIFILVITGIVGFKTFQDYQAQKLAAEAVIKVACVGDSNTYRHGGTNVQEYKYSYHLAQILGDGFEVRNFGEVGACVSPDGNLPYTTLRVFEAGVEYEADIVIVMLGTNDVWDHNWISEEHFKEEYLNIIDSYLNGENTPEVYLCTLPKLYQEDGNTLETGNGEHVEILSNAIRDIAVSRGYEVIEVNRVTENHREWYENDLLHINEKGAKGIAETMAEAIQLKGENLSVQK